MAKASENPDSQATMQLQQRLAELEHQNQELRRACDHYSDRYDLSPVGQATLSEAGEIVEANDTLARLLRVDRAELLGQPLSALIAEEDGALWATHWRELRERRASSHWGIRLLSRGHPIWARIDASVLQSRGTPPEYRLALSAAIENPVALPPQQAESILDTIRQPLLVLNPDLTIASVNRAFRATFNVSAEETIGQLVYTLGNGQWDIPALRTLLEEILPRDQALESFEVEHTFPTIGHRVMLLNARRLQRVDGQGTQILLAIEDATERVLRERALERLNERLTVANEELRAFSYSVSHDLRAPLRSIDGFSLALLEDFGSSLDPVALDYLGRVRNAAQRMAHLIDGLLQLSRIIRAEPEFRRTDLSAMAQEIANALQEADPQRCVVWEIERGLVATVDRTLMRTVLENLLGNAWKFSSHREVAHIAFGATQGQETVYFVRDDGAGFDMAYADKLFGTFQRLHRQDEFEGSGIGLATAQRVIQLHGGRVWAEAAVNEGATFYWTLAADGPRT